MRLLGILVWVCLLVVTSSLPAGAASKKPKPDSSKSRPGDIDINLDKKSFSDRFTLQTSSVSTATKEMANSAKAGADLEMDTIKVAGAPASVAELLDHFQTLDRQIRGLSGRFSQTIRLIEADITHHVEGTFAYEKPGRLRWEREGRERQTVVSDGQSVWVHRQDINQVIQTRLDEIKKSDPLADSLTSLGNYEQLLSKYSVELNSTSLSVTLRPKQKETNFQFRLRLLGPYHFPAQSEFTTAQMHVRMEFKDLRFNPQLDPKRFEFTPPEGAQVYRDFKIPAFGKEER